jgi:hypothetical protein
MATFSIVMKKLEAPPDGNPAEGKLGDGLIPAQSNDLAKVYLETMQRIYDREEARRDGAERQAMTLLGVTGVVASLFSGLAGLLFQFADRGRLGATISLAILFALILFSLLLSILYALRSLRRIPIYLLSPREAETTPDDTVDTYRARISSELANDTTANYGQTDLKVGHLKYAQRAFCLGVILILITGMFTGWLAVSSAIIIDPERARSVAHAPED